MRAIMIPTVQVALFTRRSLGRTPRLPLVFPVVLLRHMLAVKPRQQKPGGSDRPREVLVVVAVAVVAAVEVICAAMPLERSSSCRAQCSVLIIRCPVLFKTPSRPSTGTISRAEVKSSHTCDVSYPTGIFKPCSWSELTENWMIRHGGDM